MPINYYCAIAMNGSDIEMNRNELLLPVIDNETSAPATGSEVEGQMYYNTSTNIMYFYNGSAWVEMDGTGSGVSAITAGTGIGVSGATGNVTVRNIGLVSVLDGTYIDLAKQGGGDNTQLTADLSATGTPDNTKFLRGDNHWAEADKNFVFVQGTPSTTWVIQHNLGKFPSITVIDTADTVVIGEYTYTDINKVTLTFSAGFAGKAYLN